MESMSTFVVSAFWHGFYPSYYIMFVMAAILQEINKDVYKSWAYCYKLIPYNLVRYILAYLYNMLCMNFFGILFGALTKQNSFFFLSTTYYFIPILLVVSLVGCRAFNIVGKGKKLEK
jgi:lysophospholipid acyltransferase